MSKLYPILIILLIVYSVIATTMCNSQKQSNGRIEANAKGISDSLHHELTKSGTLLTYTKAQEGTISELKATNAAIIKDRNDKIGVNQKNLQGAQDLIVKLRMKFDAAVNDKRRGDTVATSDRVDSFNKFHSVTTIDTATGIKTMHVIDTPIVPLHLTEYTSKWSIRQPFAEKIHYVCAYSDNCDAYITGLESILVLKEKPRPVKIIGSVVVGIAIGLFIHSAIK